MDLALWECARLWPFATKPDVVLSLGTGKEAEVKTPRSPKAPTFRHLLNDGFIPRLCRSFMSSLDGERAWRDSINRLDSNTRADYFRLNVPYLGAEPRLDDIECIGTLRSSVHLQPQGSRDRSSIACALLTASFYFELDELPNLEAGQYLCRGTIRCRNNSRAVLRSFAKLYKSGLDFTTGTETLGSLTYDDICDTCHVYGKRVQLNVRQLEDVLSISIRINGLERRKISGSPHNILWYAKQQALDAPFGRVNHDSPMRWVCQACVRPPNQHQSSSRATRKRKSSHLVTRREGLRKRARIGPF